MTDWRKVRLGDVASELTVGHVGPMVDEYRDSGVPFLRSQNVRPHRIDTDDMKYIDTDFHVRLKKSTLKPGDVVTVRTGKPGQTTVVPDWMPAANCSDLVITRPGPALNARWLSYYMNWVTDSHIAGHLVGAVQQHFNVKSAKGLELLMPPLAEQRAIAEALGALDDKIAANDYIAQGTDELLEARFSRLRSHAGLGKLADIATVNASIVRPDPDGHLRYLDISSVACGSYDFPPITSWEDAPGRARRALQVGDTVWSTVRPNRRSHALVLDDAPELVGSTGLAVLTPHDGRIASVYESTRTPAFVGYLESVAEGSAYPAVRADRFAEAPVPALSAYEWDHFESFALPLRKRAHAAARESRSLAATRDGLLPLLMAGQVRVQDAEKVVEEVV